MIYGHETHLNYEVKATVVARTTETSSAIHNFLGNTMEIVKLKVARNCAIKTPDTASEWCDLLFLHADVRYHSGGISKPPEQCVGMTIGDQCAVFYGGASRWRRIMLDTIAVSWVKPDTDELLEFVLT